LGFSNWPVIYYKPTSFLAPSNAIKFSGFIITVPPSAVLRELALARFPEDAEVADAMHRAEDLAVQQPGDPAAFVATT
jgi:hypothetical protein